jgi:hypothetical protein
MKIGDRIEIFGKVSLADAAEKLDREFIRTNRKDWVELLTLGRKAFIEQLDAELESLIAVEPESKPQTKPPEWFADQMAVAMAKDAAKANAALEPEMEPKLCN